jgi:hypothetical protein
MRQCLFCIIFLWISCYRALSQHVKDASAFIPTDKGVELGINVTSTLAGFFNSGGDRSTIDPYILSIKIANTKGAVRLGMYGAIKQDKNFQCVNSFCGSRTIHETLANIRAGYEQRIPVTNRFVFFWGLDGIVKLDNSETTTDFQTSKGLISSKKLGFGGGGVAGVQFWIHKRISLSTETSLYGVYSSGINKTVLPSTSGGTQSNPISSFQIVPILPSSLFFNFRF